MDDIREICECLGFPTVVVSVFSKWLLEISDGDMMDILDIHGYYQLKTQQMNCRSIWTDSLRLMIPGWRFDIYNRRSASALGGEV